MIDLCIDFDNPDSKKIVLDYLMSKSRYIGEHIICIVNRNDEGYGQICVNGRRYKAHRLACWIYFDLDLNNLKKLALHKRECSRRDCWNKDHLYIGNRSENNLDARAVGKYVNAKPPYTYVDRPTHCKRGHERTKENTYTNPYTGRRQCKICAGWLTIEA